ncbi:peroxiredoxin [Perkinsela sp. CCAP 1560/4]|nr:peroxiredoxin [Perkinsela sp. CCAP 1560/4]|eukprot:KNH04255.1 peroxiredoxin [Perkinsela sp. CCAP 1560/4]
MLLHQKALRFFAPRTQSTRASTARLISQPTRAFANSAKVMCYADYETFQIATVRKEAPLFTAKAVIEGKITPKPVSLVDFRGKYVVVLFYPLDFTFVCPTEVLGYNKRLKEFEEKNTQVLAISVDSVYSHLAWSTTPAAHGGLNEEPHLIKIPMLSDITKEISKDYGVLIESEGIALRGQFIIDMKGIVRHVGINDLPIGRSVDETLRLLNAVQYSDNNKGNVMPCDWQPGKATIKP